ncbi:hypothetical protein [Leptolyngbya sp. GGD]|uniref:hypothetical protein n=1 Tax=Leptolyngbya sp. GGD TaxID=2997907 RepID=UPI00227CA044|nr:hypothetical protein [Leptolyngbya sp. GGD]MCY6492113.1 hypothetical protein [Leptolyngbya sp. GGD]
MRSITAYKSKLTTAIAQIYGRNLQNATEDQLSKLISDCLSNFRQSDYNGVFRGSKIYLSRDKDGVNLSVEVTPESKIDALRTLSILANIAADREAEKATAQQVESALNRVIEPC